MDRSADSIGSCSLDVDADSSDISDTSGSLNFPTPISVKDITREFTANIRERCSVHTVQQNSSTVFVDPASGQVRMVLTQPTSGSSSGATATSALPTPTATTTTASGANKDTNREDKKPSYLNLACCVNGYSNLTTYDSKIRQDINKSREVSPIRPSSSTIQYCKKNNSLAPPVLLQMPNISKQPSPAGGTGAKYGSVVATNHSNSTKQHQHNNGSGNGSVMLLHDGHELAPTHSEHRSTSFIQQRVERLYGPGALAQGFYSPKKVRSSSSDRALNAEHESGNLADTELSRKFQQLSPSKDYSDFRKKLAANGAPNSSARQHVSVVAAPVAADAEHADSHQTAEMAENNSIDLPCLRHLSQEFRAQLPTISPKRNTVAARNFSGRDASVQSQNGTAKTSPVLTTPPKLNDVTHSDDAVNDVVDHKAPSISSVIGAVDYQPTPSTVVVSLQKSNSTSQPSSSSPEVIVATDVKKIESVTTSVESPAQLSEIPINSSGRILAAQSSGSSEKDGNYFLHLLKDQQVRLLVLASEAEKYIDALSNNPEITEDTMGFLRAAAGKARLLVSQKMKQFEGLCHNNLNRSPEDKFPTTVDDLQGFWDMVNLQVDHIDSIFAEIEILKNNDWKKPKNVDRMSNSSKQQQKSNKTGNLRTKTSSSNGTGVANTNVKTPVAPAVMSAAALKRESQRKKLLEMKRKNRNAMVASTSNTESKAVNSSKNTVEIFVSSENNKNNSSS